MARQALVALLQPQPAFSAAGNNTIGDNKSDGGSSTSSGHISSEVAKPQPALGWFGQKVKEDNAPKLLKKGDIDPFAPKVEAGKDGAPPEVDGDGGSPYQTTYFNFTDEFTSNLKASTSLIQVSLACSTHRDGRVPMWLKKHELALRSAILEVLADTTDDDVNSLAGKDKLQKRLTAAINKVLIDEEGYGGVDNVYFKSFLVQ